VGLAGPSQVYQPASVQLPELTPETKAIVERANARRIALLGDQQLLRSRYDEIMRWLNPYFDTVSRRVDPRSEGATAARDGHGILHVDLIGQAIIRWAALEIGKMPTFHVDPRPVAPPFLEPDIDPQKNSAALKQYNLERASAESQSTQMEYQTTNWIEDSGLHRTLLQAAWSKHAFGKAIVRTGWDPFEERPTAELIENPSQVYYGWTKRTGARRLAWVNVVDQMSPEEANFRFGLQIPVTAAGGVDLASWTGTLEQSDMDLRPEQQQAGRQMIWCQEYWELNRTLTAEGKRKTTCAYALIVADRVVEMNVYPWQRLPFHVFENVHIPTWAHGKSTAEVMIPINEAYDNLLDRQGEVIDFESGPRYLGLNMGGGTSHDDVDLPPPFKLLPLREGVDVRQLQTSVDFFPSQLHAQELREAKYRATGLTPIAEGMSYNSQTSGRAMTAEWQAVDLPLSFYLVSATPEIRDIFRSWWDYGEEYIADLKTVAKGYRRFRIIWEPLDVRDTTEKTMEITNLLAANVIDPEKALEMRGFENGNEILARVRAYLVDPVWNPLRYQQYLTLQQLELTIRQQAVAVAQQEAAAAQQGQGTPASGQQGPAGTPSPDQLAQQGANAAGQAAQQGTAPGGPGQNQPGETPAGIPMQSSLLSRSPLVGGVGVQTIVPLGGAPGAGAPVPAAGTPVR
jgi:hypothetical protein